MENLKTLTPEEIKSKFNFQKEQVGWTFYSEREFIENLFNQRFNYLIVMYSLFIAAAATVNTKQNLMIVLVLGFTFTILIGLTVYRAFVKLIILLRILHKLEDHVFPLIQREMETWGWKKLFHVNHFVGIIIPLGMVLTFIIGIILTWFEIICP